MQKAFGPHRIKTLLNNYRSVFFGIAAFLLSAASVNAQIFTKPNNSYGTTSSRENPDSVLYFPTACGVPTDSTWLFSEGFNHRGEKKKKAAHYYDSCGHHEYVWDPSLKAWHVVDSSSGSGGGGSAFSLRAITSSNFSTSTNCPLPALNGDSLQIFWNDLGRFLVEGVEWNPLAGGGFSISVPGFDASAVGYSLSLYSNTASTTPGPSPFTSSNFTTATNCPIPAYNGMQLSIFWNDANRYLVQGIDWTPLAGGGMTITIPGFDATTTIYSFYIFNQ